MPRLALGFCIVWFASLFVFRTVVQWRRTGSTGLKGFHGRVGSLPWFAGATMSVGFLIAFVAPIAALLGGPASALLFSSAPVHLLGAVLGAAGLVGALSAQLSMGDSWRVGVDESEKTELVVDGLFAWIRNPIFSFVGVSVLGLVLLVPNVLAVLACVLTVVGIELQVRVVEEPFLAKTHGEEYARYVASVGRFVPRIAAPARADATPPMEREH